MERMIITGHAEFAEIAVKQDEILSMTYNYENILEQDALGQYAKSKPPGQLISYIISERISSFIVSAKTPTDRLSALRKFASYAWPCFSLLVLMPIYYLGKLLFSRKTALLACLLFIYIPSFCLVTLHTDQVLFPLLFTISLLMIFISVRKQNCLISYFTGVFIYISCFFSFAIMVAVPFGIMAILIEYFRKKNDDSFFTKPLALIGFFILGFVSLYILFKFALNYDAIIRYQNALHHHIAWKYWKTTIPVTTYWAAMNFFEFFFWLGFPLSIILLASLYRSIQKFIRNKFNSANNINLLFFTVIFALALFGKTKGEVARLWIFLIPAICIFAAREILIYARALSKQKRSLILLIIVLQFGTILLIKLNQDFH
ncbi:MAG: hypothetical protein ACYS8W_04140 [Planctomycetota bacterium]